jgi:hypothetical protein
VRARRLPLESSKALGRQIPLIRYPRRVSENFRRFLCKTRACRAARQIRRRIRKHARPICKFVIAIPSEAALNTRVRSDHTRQRALCPMTIVRRQEPPRRLLSALPRNGILSTSRFLRTDC